MTLLFLLCGIALATTYLFLRPGAAHRGTFAAVPDRLAKLKAQADPREFLGFCTRDEDTLYFVFENGVFNLDYELNTESRKAHAADFRQAATDLGLRVIDTAYGNFPVLRIPIDSDEHHAAKIALDVARRMFGHDEATIFDFLP